MSAPVTVIVPVYGGLDDVTACLGSERECPSVAVCRANASVT